MKDYKKILEGVMNIINTTEKSDIGFADICVYIFENCPELKKSEDEKIRKEIYIYLDWLDGRKDCAPKGAYSIRNMIAWLEKQGDKNPVVVPKFRVGDIITPKGKKEYYTITDIVDGWYEFKEKHVNGGIPIHYQFGWELVEQKPVEKTTWYDNMDDLIADAMIDDIKNADIPEPCKHNRITWINKYRSKPVEWSKDEKRKLDRIYSILGIAADEHAYATTCRLIGDNEAVELQDFLRSIAKPKQEWSEEDEKQIRQIERIVKNAGCTPNLQEQIHNWLKSLRPQSHWKPSGEQIDALEIAIKVGIQLGSWEETALRELQKQLKAL